jgi:precorrin-2 dehydrogenase/sirohydrochlorin ferrochelatase
MKYYPVLLDIRHKKCLVVGGGSVGSRKVATLLACDAEVTVVSPLISDKVRQMMPNDKLVCLERPFRCSDVDDMFLVIGATDDEDLNQKISAEAHRRNILCNIADRPKACNFILPSIVHRGDLLIAISTSGQSPAFARKLRQDLEKQFGPEYELFLIAMGAIRHRLLTQAHEPEAHKPIFERLIQEGLLHLIQKKRYQDANALIKATAGVELDLESLLTMESFSPSN